MSRRRRWLQRYLDLFVMEMHGPDGSSYLVAIDSTGFGDCWMPIDVVERPSNRCLSGESQDRSGWGEAS